MTIRHILLFGFLLSLNFVFSQNPLNQYIEAALAENLSLRKQHFSYEKSLVELQEAKAFFYPQLQLNARLSLARGGREIEFPVGSLLDPVHTAVNGILGAVGDTNRLPVGLPDESFNFLRETEHETTLRLIQPLIEPSIYFNFRIRQDLVEMQAIEREAFKRQLVADVKTAYFNYLISEQVLSIYQEGKELLQENLRVNESLVKNDKLTVDVLYRVKAEISQVDAEIATANKNVNVARAYFNTLLNRSLDQSIQQDTSLLQQSIRYDNLESSQATALSQREEISQLNMAMQAQDKQIRLNKFSRLPSLTLVADYGFQGTSYRFTAEDDFFMGSLILQWDLFSGLKVKNQIKQAEIDLQSLQNQQVQLKQQIQLQVQQAWFSLVEAEESLQAANAQVKSAKSYFRLIEKKYKQQQSPLIEYLDARNTLTNAQAQLSIAQYRLLVKYAEYERTSAIYEL